jgi:tripartite-type tricarboxylate transporter receptor subunit TctC
VQVMFVASTVEYIKTGKVRALAVTTPTRICRICFFECVRAL